MASMRVRLWFGLGLLLLLLVGCTDPYDKDVPPGNFTDGQASRIARDLPEPDQSLFLRWSHRMDTNDRFPGESIPPTVRSAILNQKRFEQFDAERRVRIAEEQARIKKLQEQEDLRQEILRRKQRASELISQFLIVRVIGYRRQPVWSVTGRQIGWDWIFDLALQNKGPKRIVAFRGSLDVSDVFNKQSIHMSGQVNTDVPPGKIIQDAVSFPNNDDSPMHVAMQKSQGIRYEWTIDSVAFSDGTTFDYMALDQSDLAGLEAR